MFWVWLVAMAFSQAAYNSKLKPGQRAALFALVLGAFFVALVQNRDWTSGWLPPAFAFGAILIFSRSRWSWIAFVVGALALVLKADSIQRLIYSGGNTYSLMTRLEAWRIIAEIVKANPLLGLGPANYYFYTPLYSILGYTVQFNSHNNYVDLIAQVGLLGLLAFLWFSAEVGWLGLRLRTLAPAGFAEAYVYGALGGLVGTLVAGMLGDWFLPFVYNVGLSGFRASVLAWVFLGGLVAIRQMIRTGALPPAEGGAA
jgi:O-antigen ligase